MKFRINKDLLLIFVLSAALIAGVAYMGISKNIQDRAFFATASMSVLPSDKITAKIGDNVTVKLYVNAGNISGSSNGALVQNVRGYICYGDKVTLPNDEIGSRITVNTTNGFKSEPIVFIANNCVNLTVVSDKVTGLKSGAVEVATIKLKAVAAGDGAITVSKENSRIAGISSTLDKLMEIGQVAGTTYSISQPTGPQIKFKTAFKDLVPNAKCMVPSDWPVSVTVMAGGVTQVHTGIGLSKAEVVDGVQMFYGQVPAGSFAGKSNVSVFIKGPKHLMNKYGVDGQTDFYNQYEGKLSLTDAAKVFDFSKYPLMPGDVVGNGENQDGIVDGVDYSYVKTKMVEMEEVEKGGNLKADFDGTCLVNSLDVSYLLYTLGERQEQLY